VTTNTRIAWAFAAAVADEVLAELTPFCTRIEVAGSVRRRRETVKDVEVVCVPRVRPPALDMFGKPLMAPVDTLGLYLSECIKGGAMWRLRPGKDGRTTFGGLNKLLLRRVDMALHLDGWMPVDVFTATDASYGRDLWVRTGPADLNTAIATLAMRAGTPFHAYGPNAFTGKLGDIQCPDEESFAKVLGIPCRPPRERTNEWAVELLKRGHRES